MDIIVQLFMHVLLRVWILWLVLCSHVVQTLTYKVIAYHQLECPPPVANIQY